MDRFLSSAVNRIDQKGRVSVPAHFRAVLAKRGEGDLYALRALDMPALDVGGLDLLDRYEQRIAQEDPFTQAADDMSFFCHGDGAFLKLDGDGRITMTDFMREHTGIEGEVAFVGRGPFFQMWEPQRFQAYRDEARARLSRLRGNQSGARALGATE
ncbi:division/cell wall cluster transcriptional repressor MraZ [Aquibium microcysteis]|uniref:division/cell wall cluster transcriptional repressor MraZ n=1 Tax=Aquibium microcysteis TaxID=675281 RepID=UPI00165D07F6|nr:division/cell wall cluster transcriptional repressor MraZ [Aquibium microcysteis]